MTTHKNFWQRAAVRAGLAAGTVLRRPIAGEDGPMDPAMSALLRWVRRMPPPQGGLVEMRHGYEAAASITGLRLKPGIAVADAVAGEGGDAVPVRRYLPAGGGHGTLVFFHGGGFALGSLHTHDRLCRTLAARCGLRVVSVGYRLAPEHPFPAAVDDAVTALSALAGTEPGPLAVAGDSAGAQLAVVAMQSNPHLAIRAHLLLYPVVDMVGGYRSEALFGDGFLLTIKVMQTLLDAYVPAGIDRAEPRLSPLRGPLPPVPGVVVAAGFDPLRDQARAYAAAQRDAGVDVRLLEERGLIHGFADFGGVIPEARRAVLRAADALRALMQVPEASA